MSGITEITDGYPNANGHIPFECANIAEVLNARGWNTYAVGKWHLTSEDEMNLSSSKRQWPLGRGFERFYGFLGGETNQWYPDLVYDNHPVPPPRTPEDGYHLTEDLADKAIEFVQDAKAIAPDKPFFLYFCPGRRHAPHHVAKEWADRYKGRFDMGYEAYREMMFARQKQLGSSRRIRSCRRSTPTSSQGPDGQSWPALDTVRPWASLSAEEQRLFARMAEVYAGFLSHADHQIGRILDYLEATGQLDDTIVVLVSDNGASGEGGPNGSVNENKFFNGVPDTIEQNLRFVDVLGSPKTYNHYPTGWAWRSTRRSRCGSATATCGAARPTRCSCRGRPGSRPGASSGRSTPTRSTSCPRSTKPSASTSRTSSTAIRSGRSRASASWPASMRLTRTPASRRSSSRCSAPGRSGTAAGRPPRSGPPPRMPGASSVVSAGSCSTRMSTRANATTWRPRSRTRLQELIAMWWVEAGKYQALPLETRTAIEAFTTPRPQPAEPRNQYIYYPGGADIPKSVAPDIRNRSYTIAAEVDIERADAEGVLFSQGSQFGGHALYVRDGKLKYAYNFVGERDFIVESTATIPTGHVVLSATFAKEGSGMPSQGRLTLHIRDQEVGAAPIMTQPGKFGLGGGGLVVGRSGPEPVVEEFAGAAPHAFAGGTIVKVVIDVSGEPFMDLAREAAALFARQ